MKEETYPIEISKNQMRDFKTFYEFLLKNYPFMPKTISDLHYQMIDVFFHCCWKHKIRLSSFRHGITNEVVCSKCYPKEYKELKSQYQEETL